MVAFERSRSSIAEFCATHALVERTFCWWRWRLGREPGAPDRTSDVRLVPVEVAKESAPSGDVVVLAVAGIEIRVEIGTDIGYVAALVGELRSRC